LSAIAAHENYPKASLRLDPQLEELLRGLEAARISAAQAPTPVIHTSPSPAPAPTSAAPPTTVATTPATTTATTHATTPQDTTTTEAPAAKKTETEAEKKADNDARANNLKKMAEKKAETGESNHAASEKPTTETNNGELVIRTCIFTGCRRARADQYLCHKHAQNKPRPDGLLATVVSWSLERYTTITVLWEIQMMVLPANTKYGQKLSEPLMTITKLRFSDLQGIYKKIKAVHKAKPGYHDDLKELPKFANRHELSTAGKFFGSNEVFNDEFLAQRQVELQTWLDRILEAPKIKFISEFWTSLGLRCVDGEYLEKDVKK